jgi:hypothetical protein
MNEMEMLTQLRGEVPLAPPTPGAERLFRAGLADIQGGSRARGRWPGRSWLPKSAGVRLATASVLAGAVAAGVLVAVLPGGGEAGSPAPGPAISVQLLADRAAKAALAGPSVPPGQWVYYKVETRIEGIPHRPSPLSVTQEQWWTADGEHEYIKAGGRIGSITDPGNYGNPLPTYSQLSSLPADPAALDTYLAHLDYQHPTAIDTEVSDFTNIRELLTTYVLPPSLVAELYRALADIPTVTVREHVTDIAGQTGIAFVLPETPNPYVPASSLPSDEQSSNGGAGSDNQELILSTTDYRILGDADWASGGTPANPTTRNIREEAYLSRAFVSGPGVLP